MPYYLVSEFKPADGIGAYRVSNPSIMLCTGLRASLDVSYQVITSLSNYFYEVSGKNK